jgi:DNA-binding CsgD family transcriptional regulator
VSAPHFEALLTSLYEAALDARLWPAALQQLVAFVGTSGSHLFLLDGASGLVTQDAYYGMPEVLMSEYDTGHVLQCPRVHNAHAHPERTILYDYQHTDEREIDRSDYYHWLQSRGDGIRYSLGARLSLLNDTPGFLSFAFRKSEGHAQSRHIRRVRRILPHVNRAIQIGQRLGASRIAAATYAEALARQAVGVVALDERGHVLLAHSAVDLNGGATRWLRVRSDGVRLADGAADRRLQRQIGLCQRIAIGGSGEVAQPLVVRTAVGDFRLSASPLLLRGEPLGAPQARVLLTIERLEPRDGYGRSSGDLAVERLSPAEQRVAKLLMQGCAIVVVARELGISVHTARSHLKSIYAKTGVHRQAQLVAHLMRCQTPS